jgi:hypothetical protein
MHVCFAHQSPMRTEFATTLEARLYESVTVVSAVAMFGSEMGSHLVANQESPKQFSSSTVVCTIVEKVACHAIRKIPDAALSAGHGKINNEPREKLPRKRQLKPNVPSSPALYGEEMP